MWDFDNDGNYDLITTDPKDPAAVWTWPDPHPAASGDEPITVTVHLKVVDSGDSPQSDETFKTLIIAEPPHAPYASIAAPASASVGVQVRLSGAGSFDIDPTDYITEYQWDFNNDDVPDLVTNTPTFLMRFEQAGLQTLGLRVVDNGVMSDGKLTSEWDYATCLIGDNLAPVADIGGPYTVYEGVPVTLVATNSYDPNGDALFYAWDFDGDGTVDSTNAVVEHTWTLPGANTIWLTVSDSALSNITSIALNVLAVNHAPSFAKGADQTVDEDSGSHTVPGWATGMSVGPSHESGQTYAFGATNSAPSLFSAQPTVSIDGTLTFVTALNANGTAVVSVWMRDSGGTDYGGQDTSSTQTFQIVVNAVNDAPVLTVPTNQTINELTLLSVTNTAADADVPPNTLRFELLSGPAGLTLDPANGAVAWTPTEAQGPSTNDVTVRVYDDGTPSLAATNTFKVVVISANTRPTIDAIPDITLLVGETLDFTVPAHDSDLPSNVLAYALSAYYYENEPPVHEPILAPDTGRFVWVTDPADEGNLLWFVVTVPDDGAPPLSTTRIFQVTVNGYPPTMGFTLTDGVPQLGWSAISSRHYQIQYKNNLNDPEWQNLGGPIKATSAMLSVTDNDAAGHPSRFYRAVLLPAP